MGILSIGEVVGIVSGGALEPEPPPQKEAPAEQAHAMPPARAAEQLARELRMMAWRQTRLQAD